MIPLTGGGRDVGDFSATSHTTSDGFIGPPRCSIRCPSDSPLNYSITMYGIPSGSEPMIGDLHHVGMVDDVARPRLVGKTQRKLFVTGHLGVKDFDCRT